ncbi:MAG: DNA polymerase IV [Ignavibacteriales bacterium]|nr:DNA polymerase IV [Ignavibacteriales bacterium]
MRTIFHLDLDAFFVSVERILDPKLNGKPVIVGGDPKYGRGVVSACSYEARAFGLHSAMPIRTAYKLCPHGIYLQGHGDEYTRFSKIVKNILEQYAPQIEQASIDEFYLDMTGTQKMYGSMFGFATRLQKEIWDKIGLPISIGIGINKTIAKIGSDCMKPKGITYIIPGMEEQFLAPMPVETIPGVGKVMQQSLNSRGIYRIADITNLPSDYFGTAFGKYGIDLWRKAHGEGTEYLTIQRARKSISRETTFGNDVTNEDEVKNTLFYLAGKVAQSLRKKGWETSTIDIKLRYTDFQTLTRAKTIKPTDDDKVIFETVWNLMKKARTRRVGVRLIGVGVTNFSPLSEQEFLFEDYEVKRKKMLRAVTKVRDKYGYESLMFGRTEEDKKLKRGGKLFSGLILKELILIFK